MQFFHQRNHHISSCSSFSNNFANTITHQSNLHPYPSAFLQQHENSSQQMQTTTLESSSDQRRSTNRETITSIKIIDRCAIVQGDTTAYYQLTLYNGADREEQAIWENFHGVTNPLIRNQIKRYLLELGQKQMIKKKSNKGKNRSNFHQQKNQPLNLKFPNGSILQTSYIRILESVQIPNSTRHLFRILWDQKQSESEGIWHQFHPKDYANRILFRELKRFQSEQKRKQQMEGRKLLEEMKMKQTNEKFDDIQNAKALYQKKENPLQKYQQSDRSVSLKKKPKKLIKRQKRQMKNCQKRVTRLQSMRQSKCQTNRQVIKGPIISINSSIQSQTDSQSLSNSRFASSFESENSHQQLHPIDNFSYQPKSQEHSYPYLLKLDNLTSTASSSIKQLEQRYIDTKSKQKFILQNIKQFQSDIDRKQLNEAMMSEIESKCAKNIDRNQIKSIRIIDRYKSNPLLTPKQKKALLRDKKNPRRSCYYYKVLYDNCSEDEAVWENFSRESNPIIKQEIRRFIIDLSRKECKKIAENSKSLPIQDNKVKKSTSKQPNKIRIRKKCPSRTTEKQEIELQFENHSQQCIKIKTSYIKILQSKSDPSNNLRQTFYRIIWSEDQPENQSRWYKFKKQDHEKYLLYRQKDKFFKRRWNSNRLKLKQLPYERVFKTEVNSEQKQNKNQQGSSQKKQQQYEQYEQPLNNLSQISNENSTHEANDKIQPSNHLQSPLSTIIEEPQQQQSQLYQQSKQQYPLQSTEEYSQQNRQNFSQENIQPYKQRFQRLQDHNNDLQSETFPYHHREEQSNSTSRLINHIPQQQHSLHKGNNANKEKLPKLENVEIEIKQQHQPQYGKGDDTAIFSEDQEEEKSRNRIREEGIFNISLHEKRGGKVDDEEDISFVYVKKEFVDQKQVFLPTFEIEGENTDNGEQSHQFYSLKR